MKIIRFIGDVHGNISRYRNALGIATHSVQLGDMGAGFVHIPEMDKNDRFIRGNHDDPEICRNHPNYIPDGYFEEGIFYMGGGLSIDKEWRTPGVSWWEGEELSITELNQMVDLYASLKPIIVATHEAPISASRILHSHHTYDDSRTSQALQAMFEIHQPHLWIHAHHHINAENLIGRTRFVSLSELDHIDVELKGYRPSSSVE